MRCGGRHKPTDHRCEAFRYNQEVKRVMAERCVSVFDAKDFLARNHIIEREEWKRLENRPIFSRISTISGRVVGNGFGQGNKNTNSTLTNLIDLYDTIEPKKNRLSYADVTGKRVIDKDLDFPELRPNFRLATNTNRHSFSKDEITLESETGTSQSNDRAIISDI